MDVTTWQEIGDDAAETSSEQERRTVQITFPYGERAEQRRTAGERSFGCFVTLPEPCVGDTDYEIMLTGIPEGVMAVSAWLQEAEDGVPIVGTARFETAGVALDVRHGMVRVLGYHDFRAWSLPVGIMFLLHW